jgi:tRNA (guanine-N7-)-methyltransferase
VNGIAMLLGKIRAAGVTNLRLHPGDVRDLFDVLPDGVSVEGVPELSRPLAQGPPPSPPVRDARLSVPVWPGFWSRGPNSGWRPTFPIMSARRWRRCRRPGSSWSGGRGAAWEDWLSTRYEQKALREGRVPHYLTFRRL